MEVPVSACAGIGTGTRGMFIKQCTFFSSHWGAKTTSSSGMADWRLVLYFSSASRAYRGRGIGDN